MSDAVTTHHHRFEVVSEAFSGEPIVTQTAADLNTALDIFVKKEDEMDRRRSEGEGKGYFVGQVNIYRWTGEGWEDVTDRAIVAGMLNYS